MPVSKNQRRARHEQAESPTIGRGSPSKNDGRIGSQQFKRIAGKGLVHMVKSDIGWQEMGSSQTSTNKGDKVISAISTTISASTGGGGTGGGGGGLSSVTATAPLVSSGSNISMSQYDPVGAAASGIGYEGYIAAGAVYDISNPGTFATHFLRKDGTWADVSASLDSFKTWSWVPQSGTPFTTVADSSADGITITAGSNVEFTDGSSGDTDALTISATNTTYSVGDGGLTQKNFTTTLKTKLDGIEASADVTDSTNVNAAGAIMHSDIPDSDTGFVVRSGSVTYDIDATDYIQTGANTLSDDTGSPQYMGIYHSATASELKFYTLKAGDNITLSKNNAGGQANTYLEISATDAPTANRFTGILDDGVTTYTATSGGSDTLKFSGGIGCNVSASQSSSTVTVTYTLDIGTGSTQAAAGNHNHSGTYDNYSSWTIGGDSGSSGVGSGQTATIAGTAPISTVESGRTVTVSLDSDGVTDTHLAYNTGQHLTTSSTPTFGGATLSGELNFSSSTGSILINHEVSEADAWFFRENSTNWGLYWKNANANHKTFGGYTSVGAEFLGMKNGSATNAVHINSAWGGTDSDTYATWMLSNYSGVFWCASHIYSEADVYAYYSSDPILKENKVLIENPLDKISKIGGYTFDWKESAKEHGGHLTGHDYGVMADEVEDIFPEMVQKRGDGIRAVKYEKLIPVLIEAVNELKGELDAIKHSK